MKQQSMNKTTIVKEDGRRLIFYRFSASEAEDKERPRHEIETNIEHFGAHSSLRGSAKKEPGCRN